MQHTRFLHHEVMWRQ